ncbi:DUF504 domain-containing protein [Candidatus Woesearchaeota archaeon]|nr:DUF504 domain-containing protein [Candidatus Woesearchaeota archaeon]MBW3006131.1 DUF504 domain-containing protein [Candidatus Woesearchaeota archaeon]
MIPIKELLNKIKWDKNENPEDYTVGYYDRLKKEIIEFPFTSIKEIDENFMLVEVAGEEKTIPLHAIKIVRKKGEQLWKRPISND